MSCFLTHSADKSTLYDSKLTNEQRVMIILQYELYNKQNVCNMNQNNTHYTDRTDSWTSNKHLTIF